MTRIRCKLVLSSLLFAISALAVHSQTHAGTVVSYVTVQDDGTLILRGRTVHLYGIYVPPTERTCRRQFRPLRCTSRATHALEFKIGPKFVECEPKSRNANGSLIAQCRVGEEDLSAYLLRRGWAVARPDAPIEYTTLERIARSRKIGIWGFSIGE